MVIIVLLESVSISFSGPLPLFTELMTCCRLFQIIVWRCGFLSLLEGFCTLMTNHMSSGAFLALSLNPWILWSCCFCLLLSLFPHVTLSSRFLLPSASQKAASFSDVYRCLDTSSGGFIAQNSIWSFWSLNFPDGN